MNIHQILAFIVFAFLSGMFLNDVHASDNQVWLDINIASFHSRSYWFEKKDGQYKEHKFNQNNLGIGLTYGVNNYIDINTGLYDNSYHKTSIYLSSIVKYPFPIGSVRIEPGLKLGGASGYTGTANDDLTVAGILPIAMLHLGIVVNDTASISVGYKPDFDGKSSRYDTNDSVGLVTLQVSIKL